MFQEYKKFIARGNVMDMAVGIIIGAAFTTIVNSAVADIINPLLGILTGGIDFSQQYIALDGLSYATLDAAREAEAPVVTYGSFINAVINFLIVGLVLFFAVKGVNRMKTQAEEAPTSPATQKPAQDIVLLTEIRDLLSKQ